MTLQELQEKRNKVATSMRSLLDKHPEGLDKAGEEKFAKMEADFEAIGKQIEQEQKVAAFEAKLDEPMNTPFMPAPQNGGDDATPQAYREAFFDMVRNGYSGASGTSKKLLAKFRAAQVEGTDSKGGYLVPTLIANEIIEGLNAASWIRQLANVYSTASTTEIPVDTGIPQFGWIGENGSYVEKEQTFSNVSIGAHKTGGIIKVSEELLEDSMFNLESHLSGKMIAGLTEAEEKAFLTGDGSGKPTGITVSASVGKTAASATAITADEIIDFVYSPAARYRANTTIIGSTDFVKAARKLKDGNGRYMWEPNYTLSEPEKLLGRPLRESEHMAAMATGEIVAVAADFRFYDVADRGGIYLQRLNEKYAENGMVGFRIRKRTDGKLTLDDAARSLKMG